MLHARQGKENSVKSNAQCVVAENIHPHFLVVVWIFSGTAQCFDTFTKGDHKLIT